MVLVLLIAGGVYAAWKYALPLSKKTSAYDHLPSGTWLVLESPSLAATYADITDSASFFRAIPSLRPIIDQYAAFALPYKSIEGQAIMAVSGLPGNLRYTCVIQGADMKDLGTTDKDHYRTAGKYLIIASDSTRKFIQPTTAKALQQLRANLDASTTLSIQAKALQVMLGHSFSKSITEQFVAEFTEQPWMCFELDSGALFHATAVSHTSNKEQHRQDATPLMRYLPMEIDAVILVGTDSGAFAVASCPYDPTSSEADNNVFILQTLKTSAKDAPIEADVLPDLAGLKVRPSWAAACQSTTLGNVKVYSANSSQLERFTNDFKAFNRMADSRAFQQLADRISSASFTLFLRTPSQLGRSVFMSDISEENLINAMVVQTNTELPGRKVFSISAVHHQKLVDDLPMLWSSTLDHPVVAGPWEFKNHYTNATELAMIDAKNELYLLNADGKTLWKKQLEEAIVGDLQVVDAFGTGKFQMLLTTPTAVHLIDRNGNDVEGFPIKLEQKTTAAAVAIQYRGSDALRILVADGTTLKNFTTDAEPVNGWKAPTLNAPLQQPVQYQYFGGKDYLLAITEHDVHLYDRTGKRRSEPTVIPPHEGPTYLQVASSLKECTIVAKDSAGNIINKTLAGSGSYQSLLPIDPQLEFLHTGEGPVTYAAIHDNRLICLDAEFQLTLDYLLPEPVKGAYWIWPAKGWIAAPSADGKLLYVINGTTGMLDKLPVSGNGKAAVVDLDQNGVKELISAQPDGSVVTYKISY